MTRQARFVISLAALLFSEFTFAQVASSRPGGGGAFVYVSSSPSNGQYQINAFSAAANGELSPVPGSPFPESVQSLAASSRYLFGSDGIYVNSFSLSPEGAPTLVSSINAQQFNDSNCGGPVALFVDRSGASLYDVDFDGNICANSTYQFFDVDGQSGQLDYLGMSDPSVPFDIPMTFTGGNTYAYGANCYHLESDIFGFQRNNNGTLTNLGINAETPAPRAGNFYCPYLTSSDNQNHLAISVQAYDSNSWQPVGPPQLATYAADDQGKLSTDSTYANMPDIAVRYVQDLRTSPSGQLLAVAGSAGLQVFRFNGNNPITRFTGLLTREPVDQVNWDNANHLYAISESKGKLFVFTVVPASLNLFEAPGSPYAIASPRNVAVLSK